jgi:hypothetical protein
MRLLPYAFFEVFLLDETQIVAFIVILSSGASSKLSSSIICTVPIRIIVLLTILLYHSSFTNIGIDPEAILPLVLPIISIGRISICGVTKRILLKLLPIHTLENLWLLLLLLLRVLILRIIRQVVILHF